ncbi:sulfotransferase [Nocardioides xinjiangensis]|uniref:sulfotransferase n=1 Tax=Nocardioides xinjiangensis TaxID=2817376 RepID=UPI001B307CBF|nr:sulfotransferase [Nocardioides sp. SYSU D00514]
MNDDVRVLYLAGSGRTGSTIVANILGQVDGYFAVGELWNIWRRGIMEARRCGCGEPVVSCPVWSSILESAFGRRLERHEAEQLDALTHLYLRTRWVRALRDARRNPSPEGDAYRGALAALYGAIRDVTGCRVIVDSSKSPVYGALLATLRGVELHAVHLLRDPRATAFSSTRVRTLPDFGDARLMRRERPYVAARRWTKNHTLCGLLLPAHAASFTRVRYEDFMARPGDEIARLVATTGVHAALPFTDERTVRLAATHSVSGNPGRFTVGDVSLRPDDEWRTAMRLSDRATVTALTWPLLLRHRYPLPGGRPHTV